jgi:hypothetical protein
MKIIDISLEINKIKKEFMKSKTKGINERKGKKKRPKKRKTMNSKKGNKLGLAAKLKLVK